MSPESRRYKPFDKCIQTTTLYWFFFLPGFLVGSKLFKNPKKTNTDYHDIILLSTVVTIIIVHFICFWSLLTQTFSMLLPSGYRPRTYEYNFRFPITVNYLVRAMVWKQLGDIMVYLHHAYKLKTWRTIRYTLRKMTIWTFAVKNGGKMFKSGH